MSGIVSNIVVFGGCGLLAYLITRLVECVFGQEDGK